MIKRLSLLFLILNSVLFASSVEEQLHKIPLKERIFLRFLFRDFVYQNHLGFVFFDEKPMAVLTHTIHVPANCIYNRYANALSARGWEVWKKFEYLFPHPNFLFIEEVNDQNGIVHKDIFFIKKVSFLKKLYEHREIFAEKLGNLNFGFLGCN